MILNCLKELENPGFYYSNWVVLIVELNFKELDSIIKEFGGGQSAVIPILHAIHEKYNYLPHEALEYISDKTEITPSIIAGVSTFYPQFRHRPAGKYMVKVCIGTACHIKGAEAVYDTFKRNLNIPDNEDTDKDMVFTVDKVACLGCCMLAPAVMIDAVTYGYVHPENVDGILKDFLHSKRVGSEKDFLRKDDKHEGEVRICICTSCAASGADKVYKNLNEQIGLLNLPVKMKVVGCTGVSFQTPLIEIITKNGRFKYSNVEPDDTGRILLNHFKPGGILKRAEKIFSGVVDYIYGRDNKVNRIHTGSSSEDILYIKEQHRIVTEFSGELDPLNIDEYIRNGGFEALKMALKEESCGEIIDIIKKSGLRGRGGAGFPTGVKWETVQQENSGQKYVICNGDEGDPGAFMDRLILESFPFRVIEGMSIAAFSVGADIGYIYIRYEYPLAIKRLETAIAICRKKGMLGDNLFNTDFKFDIKVKRGAGAFVCGEETALIAAIEGKRGMPRFRPPYPASFGLNGKPTLINNVETLALVPWIINNGHHSFNKFGTEFSKGTKTFALAGKVKNGGLIEIGMGMKLREIIEGIGGGIKDNGKLKSIQLGGPSGGCIPENLAGSVVDYETIHETGSIMGSGGLVVLDDNDCMIDIAKYFMTFIQQESCGKCTFCRIGTKQMLEILKRFSCGEGKENDIGELLELAEFIKEGSLCGLGKTAPNTVLSTIRYFRSEYEAHIKGKCPAGKCREIIKYTITDKCIGCTKCSQRCPVDAIGLNPYRRHKIDQEKCTKCDTCRQVCPAEAIIVE